MIYITISHNLMYIVMHVPVRRVCDAIASIQMSDAACTDDTSKEDDGHSSIMFIILIYSYIIAMKSSAYAYY